MKPVLPAVHEEAAVRELLTADLLARFGAHRSPLARGLAGAGVFYGASASDAAAVAGAQVFVVGGGNSAGQAAVHLVRSAASVTLLVRAGGLEASMSDYLVRELELTPNMEDQPPRCLRRGHRRLAELAPVG